MIIDCIVIDDEPLAIERVMAFASRIPYLRMVNTFNSSLNAISFLKKNQVGLIFLDIEMDHLTGLQLIETLSQIPEVIITSAYDKYALKGFELNVTDYLLKPFSFDRFLIAVERVYELLNKDKKQERDYFFVKTEYRTEKIFYKDVLFIESIRDYRYIRLLSGNTMTLLTFNELEKILPATKICRVHKSYMVAIDKIDSIERSRIRIGENIIPISETYKNNFYQLVGLEGK